MRDKPRTLIATVLVVLSLPAILVLAVLLMPFALMVQEANPDRRRLERERHPGTEGVVG